MKKLPVLIGAGCACCLAIVAAGLILSEQAVRGNIISEALLETGNPVTVDLFFVKTPEDAAIVTDISSLDTSVPGTYLLTVSFSGREEEVKLTVADTTAPTAEAVPQSIYLGTELPPAEEFVTDVYDLSGNVNVDFAEVPDNFAAGLAEVTIMLFDSYGNSSEVVSTLDVIDDCTGPEILGAKNLSVKVGEEIDLEEGITAVDDYDTAPEIYVDADTCNFSIVGDYTIAYIAVDEAGNTTRQEVTLTVLPPEGEEFNEYVYQMADDILEGIKCKKKTKTAKAIFEYVHDMMTYDSSNFGASTPEEAAFIGFTTHTGNCYIYASCCKILLDRAGISSMFITRYPVTSSGHYWLLVKLNGKWWHCDATPFMGHEGYYFMLIDSQLDQYHEFDPSKYPARSTTPSSMAVGACVGQAKDYSAVPVEPEEETAVVGEEMMTPTPTPTPILTPAVTPGDEGGEEDEDEEGEDPEVPELPPVPTVAPEETEPAPSETSGDAPESDGEGDV